MKPHMRASPAALERLSVTIPEHALDAYESAFGTVCDSIGLFRDEATNTWLIEGVKQAGDDDPELAAALALASVLSGVEATLHREPLSAGGWLARSYAGFPEQLIGRRFAIRGSHIRDPRSPGRITLNLDAGMAFGSGEHGSTRLCLRALERVARRYPPGSPRRILDLGTGSGILAIAASRLLHRPVLATDIDPWSVRLARQNAKANLVGGLVRVRRADGWADPSVRALAPYDLVLANILARPLMRMARHLAAHLAPAGTVILSGLLATQAPTVLTAYRQCGLRLAFRADDGPWTALTMRA